MRKNTKGRSKERALFVIEPCFHGANYVQAANELDSAGLDCSVVVVTRDEGPALPAGEAEVLLADVFSPNDIRDMILQWKEERGVGTVGVLPGNEYSVPAAAEVCRQLRLPGNAPIASRAVRDKRLMRYALKVAGLRCPSFQVFERPEVFRHSVPAFTYPVVAKPPDMACSMYVKLCQSQSELMEAGESIFARNTNIIDYPLTSAVMVEEYVEGPEFSVELFLSDGDELFCSLTEKEKSPPPHFVEIGHVVQSTVTDSTQSERIKSAALRATLSCGITLGPVHAEIILSDHGPVVVELAGRLPGGRITDLLRKSWGVDLHKAAIEQALGEVPIHARPGTDSPSGAAIHFLWGAPGRVSAIRHVEEAMNMPGVEEVSIDVAVGDSVSALCSSEDRLGFVIAEGADGSEAKSNAHRAAGYIEIDIDA